ncbi:DUF6907 domain-containing protein [Streptomyces sp. NBC_00483]|uniref:DUF6907 domain-containing protein n=1 Tax=Streptomyces sp. NBC_00483 TaxID=2975756 RepID=UPI002E174D06
MTIIDRLPQIASDAPVPYTVTDAGNRAADLPAIQPGYRLVPALIGTRSAHQLAYIECANWCTEDHTEYPYMLDDIAHQGDEAHVSVPSFDNAFGVAHCLNARLYSDPASSDPRMRAAHILADDDTPLQAHLTEEMADQLADDFAAFAAHLRRLARSARLANQTAGGAE